MENVKHGKIAERVVYEGYGTKESPHSPAWGNEVLGAKNGKLDHFVRSTEDADKLAELKENKVLESLASRWSTTSLDQKFEGRRWASYATSGSETNGKEALQLIGLVQEVSKYNPDNAAGLYFIDTASHSMKNQLATEAKMYSVASGISDDEVISEYLTLFQNRVDPEYIEDFIDKLGISEDEARQIRNRWSERSQEFDVPADAIYLPSQADYIAFCQKVGMESEVVMAINRAFEFVKSRDDIPQTLGSLRCAIFTETSALLAKKLGIETPIVAVPFDEASVSTGWGNLTMSQIKEFSAETFTGKVAYYNVLDPNTGAEVPQYNRANGSVEPYRVVQAEVFLSSSSIEEDVYTNAKTLDEEYRNQLEIYRLAKERNSDIRPPQITLDLLKARYILSLPKVGTPEYEILSKKYRKIVEDYEKSQTYKNDISDPRYGQIRYTEMMKHGHFSGMGYYNFLLVNSLGSLAFVFDNYEAGGPHERTVKAETEGRFQSDVVMVGYPRGWARIASFEGDENSTYGASPPLELLASELLKDPNGIRKLSEYTELLNQSIGKNTTIALDASADSTELYLIPDNRYFATNSQKVERIQVEEIPFEKVQEILSVINCLTSTPYESLFKLVNEEVVNISEEEKNYFAKFLQARDCRAAITANLDEISRKFHSTYENLIKRYSINQQRAVLIALSQLGIVLETPAMLSDSEHNKSIDVFQAQESNDLSTVQSTTEVLYVKARQSVEHSASDNLSTVSGEILPHYQTACRASELVQEYQNSTRVEQAIKSLIKAKSRNPERYKEAWNTYKNGDKSSDPAILNLMQQMRTVATCGYNLELESAVQEAEVLNDIQNKASEKSKETGAILVSDYDCKPGIETVVKNGEPELLQKKCSTIKKMIEAISGTRYEDMLLPQIKLCDANISLMFDTCVGLSGSIAGQISDVLRGRSDSSGRNRFSNPDSAVEYICQYIDTAELLSNFKNKVQTIWRNLNNNEEMRKFAIAYDKHKREISPLVSERNSIEAEIDSMSVQIRELSQKYVPVAMSTVLNIK